MVFNGSATVSGSARLNTLASTAAMSVNMSFLGDCGPNRIVATVREAAHMQRAQPHNGLARRRNRLRRHPPTI